ncbi:MAG: DUF2845 domain-containing protein [Gammaproteobacteria bacterium]|nr:MAG: DUF2845 domain-containing protein [Gammaproteobacteria bacterium]
MFTQKLILLCCILLLAEPAAALRCGGKLVSNGAPQAKVLKYCGEPESIQMRTIVRTGIPRHRIRHGINDTRLIGYSDELLFADRSYVEIVVEEWTYNFGPHRLMRIVRFENGLVTSVSRLGYGYN